MAEFKKISDTEVVEAPAENDNLVLISNGEVKQVSAAAFAAAAGGGGAEAIRLITSVTMYTELSGSDCTLEDGSAVPSDLYDLFLVGTPILLYCRDMWSICVSAYIGEYDAKTLVFIAPDGFVTYAIPAAL